MNTKAFKRTVFLTVFSAILNLLAKSLCSPAAGAFNGGNFLTRPNVVCGNATVGRHRGTTLRNLLKGAIVLCFRGTLVVPSLNRGVPGSIDGSCLVIPWLHRGVPGSIDGSCLVIPWLPGGVLGSIDGSCLVFPWLPGGVQGSVVGTSVDSG